MKYPFFGRVFVSSCYLNLFKATFNSGLIMSGEFVIVTQSQVHVKVSSNASSFLSERKVPKDMKISELKVRIGGDVSSAVFI